jgi:hypothetical protein
MTPQQRDALIDRYAEGPELLDAALAELPPQMWTFKPSPADWSVHEILIHLADSETNAFLRCRRLVAEPGGSLMAYDQDLWAHALDYHSRDTELARSIVGLVRRSTTELLRSLPDTVWRHTVEHAELDRPYTFDDWLEVYAAHIPDHIEQMMRNRAAWEAAGGR